MAETVENVASNPLENSNDAPLKFCDIGRAYINVWRKYAQFSGRSSRLEFWSFKLIDILLSLLFLSWFSDVGGLIYFVVSLVPATAVLVRRLHDINKCGVWVFYPYGILLLLMGMVSLIPLLADDEAVQIIWAVLFFAFAILGFGLWLHWLTKKSDEGANQYGEAPDLVQKTPRKNLLIGIWGYAVLPYAVFYVLGMIDGYFASQEAYKARQVSDSVFYFVSELRQKAVDYQGYDNVNSLSLRDVGSLPSGFYATYKAVYHPWGNKVDLLGNEGLFMLSYRQIPFEICHKTAYHLDGLHYSGVTSIKCEDCDGEWCDLKIISH